MNHMQTALDVYYLFQHHMMLSKQVHQFPHVRYRSVDARALGSGKRPWKTIRLDSGCTPRMWRLDGRPHRMWKHFTGQVLGAAHFAHLFPDQWLMLVAGNYQETLSSMQGVTLVELLVKNIPNSTTPTDLAENFLFFDNKGDAARFKLAHGF